MLNQKTQAALAESNQILSALGPVLRGDNSASDIHQVRAAYNAMQAKQPHPEDVSLTSVDMGGVPGLLITPDELKTDAVVMYIHGGGYLVGSPEGYTGIGGNYAKLVGARVYLPDYRLAPEHPFPAPIHDVLRAYEWLLEQGIAGKSIVLAGESAGGAMVVSVMVAARNKGLALPAGGVAISPWANLEHTGASMFNRDGYDPACSRESLNLLARSFLGEALPNHPMASPVFADVTELPPIMIQIGENEVMLSDAMRLATHLGDHRVRVTLEVWPGMFHAWHFYATILPEAMQAMTNSARFIEQVLQDAAH